MVSSPTPLCPLEIVSWNLTRQRVAVLPHVESLIAMAFCTRCAHLLEMLEKISEVVYGPFKTQFFGLGLKKDSYLFILLK